jgi:hypothetical protein
MADYTANYNLKKPERGEYYNVMDFNGNADILDGALKNTYDSLASAITKLANTRTDSIIIAASDTDSKLKANVDYVCNGSNDITIINDAISSLTNGGSIKLLPGNYNLNYDDNTKHLILGTDNIKLYGCGSGTVLTTNRAIYINAVDSTISDLKIMSTVDTSTDSVFLAQPIGSVVKKMNFAVKNCIIEKGTVASVLSIPGSASNYYNRFVNNFIRYTDSTQIPQFFVTGSAYCMGNSVMIGNVFATATTVPQADEGESLTLSGNYNITQG